ncbi:MAG: phosphonate C-P lyase system protein PhnG [Desulfoprunum sp.]|uniref:phosphonate C-P lyase system protein PhnG n=1 Tax=Desulfoprunum sp. TaxID=2020866 RepID=UPI003C710A44
MLHSMDDQKIDELLQLFTDVELTVSLPPRTGLVMLTVQDSLATAFHVGEVLVTEARVLCHGSEGYGLVAGDAPRRALARAAADAVLRCPEAPGIRQALQSLLHEEELRQNKRQADQAALVAATKVNFDLMPGA